MLQFISSFIPEVDSKELVYDWSKRLMRKAIDPNSAMAWHARAIKYFPQGVITYESIDISLFWNEVRKSIPVFLNPDAIYEDESKRANEVIRTLSKAWLISDEYYQLLQRIFEYYKIHSVLNEKSEKVYAFRKIKEHDTPYAWMVEVTIADIKTEIDVNMPIPEMSAEEWRYKNVMLLLKEVQDGYVSFRNHSIVNKSWDTASEQRYKIWQDIVVKIRNREVISAEAVTTRYDISKEDGTWYVMYEWKRICPTDDFQYVRYRVEWDVEVYEIFWAYTHILRKVLGFNPQTWQYLFLMRKKRLNAVAWSRRAGKTILSSYLVIRDLYKQPSSRKHSLRQRKVLYIAPSEDKFKAVLDYIDASVERIKILRTIKYTPQEKRYKLIDESLGRNKKIVQTQIATCDFASAKGYEPWRGNGSDLVIIDEAAYIREDVYLNILPIVENENAGFFAISTIDWETPKQWFYERLVEYEQSEDSEAYAQRVTIDDIDDTIISKNSKERMKNALRQNMQRFYAELYATFPTISTVFDTTNFFVLPELDKKDAVKEVIIGYDPAKRSDFAWVIIAEIYKWRMHLIREVQLQGNYATQRDFLMDLKKEYHSKWIPCNIIIDATIVGDVIADVFGSLIDYRVWYANKTWRPETDKWWVWKYSKRDLVWMTTSLMTERMVTSSSELTTLMTEIKNFKAFRTWSGALQFEAVSWHDDLVNAMMLTCFYFGFLVWQHYKIRQNIDNEIRLFKENHTHNLYEPNYLRGKPKQKNAKYTF